MPTMSTSCLSFCRMPCKPWRQLHGMSFYQTNKARRRSGLCLFVVFLFYFQFLYLNTVMTYEINNLVHRSYRCIRTPPPKLARVYKQVVAVYTFSTVVALHMVLPVKWALFTIEDDVNGIGGPGGKMFNPLVATGIMYIIILIPVIYVLFARLVDTRSCPK